MKSRRRKHQTGSICLRRGSFYVRYYGLDRKQHNEFLVEQDKLKYTAVNCSAVKSLAAKFMEKVNSSNSNPVTLTCLEFWESVYEPFIVRNRRHSTVFSYKDLWKRIICPHLGHFSLMEYETVMATQFLGSLTSRLSRNPLNHVRSLMSGFFSHACATGHLKHNPMREVKILENVRPPSDTSWYDLGTLEDIVNRLVDNPKAQLVVLLAGMMALRPSEIVGLDWSDWDGESIHIRRAVVRGKVGETKTKASVATIRLIHPVLGLMKMWHEKSGSPSKGWIFPNRGGKVPMNIREFCRRNIKPLVPGWTGLYSGRRGSATILTQLTGNPLASSQILRHKNYGMVFQGAGSGTALTHYIKNDRSELDAGLRLLEDKIRSNDDKS